LSTVEKGGATVFPYLKVYVPAVKGMAAFWYNLRDNGDCDFNTRHAACPVLLGYVHFLLLKILLCSLIFKLNYIMILDLNG
jgi:hypothetical protein